MVNKKKRIYSHPQESYRISFRKYSKKKRGRFSQGVSKREPSLSLKRRSSQKKSKSKQSASLIIRRFIENALFSGAEVKSFLKLEDAFQYLEGLFKKEAKKSLVVSQGVNYPSRMQKKFPLFKKLITEDSASAEAGLVMADYGVAETGTLVHLDSTAEERNVWTLPPFCVCLLRAQNVVSSLETISKRISGHLARTDIPSSQVSLVTGPSRTADIECQLTIGVQGPSRLMILLIR